MIFASDGKRNREIGTQIVLMKQMQFCVSFIALWSQNGSFQELKSCQFFKVVFVSILTYRHESWVMTERVMSQVKAAEMGYLWIIHGVTLRTKRAAMKFVKPWIYNHFSATMARSCDQNIPGKIGEASVLVKDQVTWLHPCLVPSWCGASRSK